MLNRYIRERVLLIGNRNYLTIVINGNYSVFNWIGINGKNVIGSKTFHSSINNNFPVDYLTTNLSIKYINLKLLFLNIKRKLNKKR